MREMTLSSPLVKLSWNLQQQWRKEGRKILRKILLRKISLGFFKENFAFCLLNTWRMANFTSPLQDFIMATDLYTHLGCSLQASVDSWGCSLGSCRSVDLDRPIALSMSPGQNLSTNRKQPIRMQSFLKSGSCFLLAFFSMRSIANTSSGTHLKLSFSKNKRLLLLQQFRSFLLTFPECVNHRYRRSRTECLCPCRQKNNRPWNFLLHCCCVINNRALVSFHPVTQPLLLLPFAQPRRRRRSHNSPSHLSLSKKSRPKDRDTKTKQQPERKM